MRGVTCGIMTPSNLVRPRLLPGGTSMRIGILTGGGDCPGLNAVIRAVVRKGIGEHGDEIVGFRDGWRGVLEARHRADGPARRPRDPAARRHRARHLAHQPLRRRGRARPGDGHPRAAGHRRADPDRRGGHPRRRDQARRGRRPRRRRPEDDRQRPGLHRLHVRLRHRRRRGDGGDRPAAHHRRQPPPHARRRGDGPARRLDRAARRDGRRRERHPHPGEPVRRRRASSRTASTASTPATRRSSSSPRAPSPRTAT